MPNPMSPPGGRGCAIVADLHGRILRCVVDELGIVHRPLPATWIVDLAAPGGQDAASALIEAARDQDPTFDRMIVAQVDGAVASLHFAALRRADELLVSAADSRIALARVHDALLDHVGASAGDTARVTLRGLRDGAREDDRADALAVDVVRIEDRIADLKRELAQARETLDRCAADASPPTGGAPSGEGRR